MTTGFVPTCDRLSQLSLAPSAPCKGCRRRSIEEAYFPVQWRHLAGGGAIIGRDGPFGCASALDGKVSLNKAIVQMSGTTSVIPADRVLELARSDDAFRSRLIRHEQVVFACAQQSAACNASHQVEARLCRWLLRMRDLIGDDLPLTQEFLGQMLGVRRTSVSSVAGSLQAAGLIRYRRGHIGRAASPPAALTRRRACFVLTGQAGYWR
jgi:hypothetical protein